MNQTESILQFFAYEHLPAHLQSVSKLLEAKDVAVRAFLFKEPQEP